MHEAREKHAIQVSSDREPHRDHAHETPQLVHASHLISVKGRCKHCGMRSTFPGVADPCRVAKVRAAVFAKQLRRELAIALEKAGDKEMTWEGWRRWLRRHEDL